MGTRLGALVADAEERQREAEGTGGEHGLVVGADRARLAVAADRGGEAGDERPGALVRERFEPQRRAARVLEDAEHGVRAAVERALAGEVDRPDEVARHAARRAPAQILREHGDLVPVRTQNVRDEGAPDADAAPFGVAAIEVRLDGPAGTGLAHQRLHAQDLPAHPVGLAAVADRGRRRRNAAKAGRPAKRKQVPREQEQEGEHGRQA